MNPSTWKSFLDDSNNLSKPAQAKQLVSTNDIAEIKLLLIKVLRDFLAKEDLQVGLKTYINNVLRNDLIEKMAANPPSLEHSFKDWSQQIFGDQKFGMILIGLEEYSNSFAEKMATIVRPLLENAGLPLDGLSFLFFMGNYGFTPFGIHKESTGEDGILFHLGPENKEFYTWDDPKYNSIEHNSEVFHNVSEKLNEGKLYELEPGDAMAIPHYVYHIGNTPKFSLSVVLDYVNPPKDRFENGLIKATAAEVLLSHDEYEKPIKLNAPQSTLNDVLDLHSIQKKMEIALTRKILGLKSNGGIRTISNTTRNRIPQSGIFSIKGKEIFPIYLDVQDSKETLIFARGHRIVLKSHPLLPQLIGQLNKGEYITLNSIRQLMEPIWDLVDAYSLIEQLLSVEAIVTDGMNNENVR
ncbi:RNA methylase [Tenacibaculum sp. nBUS_03]|uniref:RNA methylase n=1 Tax=Tenacibaculum sp. nBUS_03 TaxID=3395320 RepID=UPI003EBB224A